MSIAFVTGQKNSNSNSAGAATIAVTYPAPTTVGSLLIVHAGALAAISSVTDDKSGGSNTWQLATLGPGPNIATTEVWYSYNAGVCQTVTVTFASVTGFRFASVSEFSGVMVSPNPLDKTDSDEDGGTAAVSITTPDVTPAVSGELIFVACRNTGVGPATPNSPFTLLSNSGQADGDGYYIQTVAAAIHGDFNNTGDTHWSVQLATFKPPSASDPVDTDFLMYQVRQGWRR